MSVALLCARILVRLFLFYTVWNSFSFCFGKLVVKRIHDYLLRISSEVDEHVHVLLCHIRPQVLLVFRPN